MGYINPPLRPHAAADPIEGLPDPGQEKRQIWYLVLFLTAISLTLLGIGVLQTDFTNRISGHGSVSGMVTDEVNQPLKAHVYVVGCDRHTMASSSGRFEIDLIPAGDVSLVVVYQDTSVEYPVIVERGRSIDVGQIYLPLMKTPLRVKKP